MLAGGQTLSAAARAQQLADVALVVYEAGGSSIHLPLDTSHALVAVLKKALEREAKERPGKEWQVLALLALNEQLPDISKLCFKPTARATAAFQLRERNGLLVNGGPCCQCRLEGSLQGRSLRAS